MRFLLTCCFLLLFVNSSFAADLYVKPDPVDPFEAEPLDVDYPSLYEEGRDRGVILVIGFDGCIHCKTLINSIPQNLDGSPKYRILYVKYDKADELNKGDDPPLWDELRKAEGLEAKYPAALVLKAEGPETVTIKAFTGALDWLEFAKAAEAARIEEPDRPKWWRFFHAGENLQ